MEDAPSAALLREGLDARSQPMSLLTQSVGGGRVTHLRREFGRASRFSIGFDLRVVEGGGYTELNDIHLGSHSYWLGLRSDGRVTFAAVSPDGVKQSGTVTGRIWTTWTRLALEVDLTTSPRTAKLHVDGTVAVAHTLDATAFEPGNLTMELGISYADTDSAACSVRWDNVTVDWE